MLLCLPRQLGFVGWLLGTCLNYGVVLKILSEMSEEPISNPAGAKQRIGIIKKYLSYTIIRSLVSSFRSNHCEKISGYEECTAIFSISSPEL